MFKNKNGNGTGEIERIDAETERLRRAIASLEARSAEKRKERDRAESERNRVLGVLDDADQQGMERLNVARARWRDACDEVEEYDKRIAQLKAELQDWEPKRAEAYRQSKSAELAARREVLMRETSALCEEAIAKAAQADAAVEQAAKELAALAQEAGEDARPYQSLVKAWRRSKEQRSAQPRFLGDKRADIHRTLSVAEVFEAYLRSESKPESEQVENQMTA
jgi:hypothetical protein